MTIQQAMNALNQGKKLTHRYFMDNEYIYLKNGIIISEDSVQQWWSEFWNIRLDGGWENDWSEFKEN